MRVTRVDMKNSRQAACGSHAPGSSRAGPRTCLGNRVSCRGATGPCGFAMTPAARLSAAIEVLAELEARRRPVGEALKDWGLSHRFAGSKDRAAIASLVYDALRRRASASWLMGEATPRAVLARRAAPPARARRRGDRAPCARASASRRRR